MASCLLHGMSACCMCTLHYVVDRINVLPLCLVEKKPCDPDQYQSTAGKDQTSALTMQHQYERVLLAPFIIMDDSPSFK